MSEGVEVTATGILKEQLPEATTVAAGQTVGQAIESLKLEFEEPVAIAVNGRVVDWNHVLQPGDRLQLILAIGGGRH